MKGRSWERPGDLIAALAKDSPLHLDMINIPNQGSIEGLPPDAVVEIPAEVKGGRVTGVKIGAMPATLADIWTKVSKVHTLVAEAAVTGDRRLLEEVIRVDPAITEKQAASRALKDMLAAHADVLPQFAAK